MRLPKEKIIFVVDLLPVGSVPGRGMIDFYPLESEDSIKKILAMDWERLIPGHPGAPAGRLGTKEDVQGPCSRSCRTPRAEVQKAAREGKCWDAVEKELKLPKYAELAGLRERPAVRAAALLRPVGPRHLRLARVLRLIR